MIFSLLSVFLAMAGIVTLLSRRTFLGWILGQQLIIQAVVSFGILVGNSRGQAVEGQAASFFLIIMGVAFTVATLGLATRQLYMKKTNRISDLANTEGSPRE